MKAIDNRFHDFFRWKLRRTDRCLNDPVLRTRSYLEREARGVQAAFEVAEKFESGEINRNRLTIKLGVHRDRGTQIVAIPLSRGGFVEI